VDYQHLLEEAKQQLHDALFLHRKLGELYLLAAKLRARVDVAELFAQITP
jgi:hypothetical protein